MPFASTSNTKSSKFKLLRRTKNNIKENERDRNRR